MPPHDHLADGPPPGGPSPLSPGDAVDRPAPGPVLRLDVAYDGAGFHGFAENRDVRTVAGELAAALQRITGRRPELTCAGRTDAGVHARGQVVSLPDPGVEDPVRLRDALNALLGPEVVVRSVSVAPPGFSARFSARSRTYRYRILNAEVPDPFLADTAWWVPDALDRPALDAAAAALVGEHDFSSFCRRPRGRDDLSLVRRVLDARWEDGPEGVLDLWLTATAFCHQMVRSITGLLVDVGRGRRSPDAVGRALAARDRATVPNLAPPRGLTLWSVEY